MYVDIGYQSNATLLVNLPCHWKAVLGLEGQTHKQILLKLQGASGKRQPLLNPAQWDLLPELAEAVLPERVWMDQRQPIPEERAKIAAAQTQDRSWHHSFEAHKGKSCQLTGLVLPELAS